MAPDKMNRKRKQDDAGVAEASEVAEIAHLTTSDERIAAQVTDGTIVTKERPKKKPKPEERRSIFVRSMPSDVTNESLTAFFSEYFPVKHATIICDKKTKESKGYGFVTFTDAEDAQQAKVALDKKDWDGRKIRVEIAEPRQRNAPVGEKPVRPAGKPLTKEELAKQSTKLIVRNLPWSIKTSADLSKLFRAYGIVRYADLPSSMGKMKGFGFVTIRGRKNAEKALEAINGREIDGRTLAVDWAVDKTTWDNAQEKEEPVTDKQEQEPSKDEQIEDDEEDDEEEVAEEDDEEEVAEEDDNDDGGDTKLKDEGLEADLENFMKNHMANMEDEDDEEEDDEDKQDKNEPPKPKFQTDNTSTLFIRNLPFTTTDEQLKGFFAQHGKVRYARVVFDKATEKSAGTGFVCFVSQADAKACILGAPRPQAQQTNAKAKHSILQDESADPDGKYTLDGRLLSVAQAVNKEQAANLADSSMQKRRETDKRRLFLLSEGQVGPSSPLFKLLTQSELQIRQASAAQRKKQVEKNPSLHISLTRLALRNIPRSFGSKELKELARKAVVGFARDVREGKRLPLSKEENARDGPDAKEKDKERKLKGKGIVRQAKIVFESNTGSKVDEKSGAGKSRGYGFIEYTSHHWALMGLRYLNGLQLEGDGGRKQRLICEFSIENAQVVQRRRAIESNSGQAPKSQRPTKVEAENKRTEKTLRDNKEARGKGKGNPQKPSKVNEDAAADDGEGEKDEKFGMKQKLIARTRLVRKKKVAARGKK